MSGSSGAGVYAISPPAGTGNVAGMGEAFSLDLNSGQGNFSVPFELPEGVAGFKPRLKLEYSHGNGNGAFGLGWRLPLRQVDRRLDFGVPGPGVAETYLESGVELRRDNEGAFRPVRETTFSRYVRREQHWEVLEKDGRRSVFGVTPGARVADAGDPARVQSWLLEREFDVNGNAIEYDYLTLDGHPYLSTVRYARYVVRFTYEPRADVLTNGRAGFIRRIAHRCREISLHLATTNRKVRSLELSYEQAPYSNASLLESVRLTAHGDGVPDVVKNPLRLTYSGFDARQFSVRWVEGEAGAPAPPALSEAETALLVLDDLPLPGVLANRNGRNFYWGSDGQGGWQYPRVAAATPFARSFAEAGVQFMDMDGSGTADMLVGVGSNPLNGYYENGGSRGFTRFQAYPTQARSLPPFESGRVRVFDVQGDGLADAMYSAGRGLVSYRNRGSGGWARAGISPNVPDVSFDDPFVYLSDMTGDGLPDIVRVRSGRVEYWPNLGNGRFGDGVVMLASPRLDGVHRSPEQVLLMDVDGDGCSELVRVSARGIEVYFNQSGQRFGEVLRFDTIPQPIPETVRPVDLHGRGRNGLIYNSQRAGQLGYVVGSPGTELEFAL